VRLVVSDNGDGISREFLPFVFHRFRQEEGSISRKAGGLGLGLAVVRHLVELHGGNVSAESAGPGQGSTFTVDLPLAADRREVKQRPPIDAEAEAGRQNFERRNTDRNGDESSDSGAGADTIRLAPTEPARSLTNVHVLLVEDDDDSRQLLSLVLQRYGAEVRAVSSAAEALDAYTGTRSRRSH
jgi:hypothetical protein